MKFVELKKYWYIPVLIFIVLFAYHIRSINIIPDRLLSFDPIFQYRFTKYLADWGHLPAWDELTYYVGRKVDFSLTQPLMYYITALVYWIFGPILKLSLMTVASYMSAIYGALIVIPAFLLGKELSNKYGGLLAAALIGTAPQILVRTFGSSYDTDQIVLFFLVLNLYLGFYALRKRTIPSFCLAIAGFSAFMLTWNFFLYPYVILVASVIFYFILSIVFEIREKKHFSEKIKNSFSKVKTQIIILLFLAVGMFIIGFINNTNVLVSLSFLIGFAQSAEQLIVNISIAELQPFSIFSLEGWITATGRFFSGDTIIDMITLLLFLIFLICGIAINIKKKNVLISSFVIVLFVIAIYTSFRGVRFTEFTSALFIILISVGFGNIVDWSKKDKVYNSAAIGAGILIILFALSLGLEIGKNLGPDQNSNWENAWDFLRTKTPELSIVGTWWDPGHMITGLAERRAFADGAHCGGGNDGSNACLYIINDRITDLGKIMVTSDENVSMNLIRKYQGNSPKVYWIASDDLIGKFQWLQYFGTGCDAREANSNCPLYIQVPESSRSFDNNGNIAFRIYNLGQQTKIMVYNSQIPIPLFVQGIDAVLFDEFIFYNGTQPVPIKFNESERDSLLTALKPLESSLNVRFSNQTIPMTLWIPNHFSYVVAIPPHLRESVFTKMFMLEGQGLTHFKQVLRNEQVKIYEVI